MDVKIQPLVSILNPLGDYIQCLVILVRLAAFRLVEAGMETKPGIESLFYFQCMHCMSSWKHGLIMIHNRSYPRATVSK